MPTSIQAADKRQPCLAIGLSIAIALAACDQASSPDPTIYHEGSALIGGNHQFNLWNNNQLGTAVQIPVCFSVAPIQYPGGLTLCPLQQNRNMDCNGTTSFTYPADPPNPAGPTVPFNVDAIRQTIRTGVENTWQRYANIEFLGWGDCPTVFVGIDPKPVTMMANLPSNIVVALTGGPDDADIGKVSGRANLVRINWAPTMQTPPGFPLDLNYAHEFGHALGFPHEWVRQDYVVANSLNVSQFGQPCNPDPGELHSDDGTAFHLTSSVDYHSIMDKCKPPPIGPLPALSSGDVTGVQMAYGRKYNGSLVGFRGQCVDIQNAATPNGTPIIAFPCRGQWNDTWFRTPSSTLEWLNTGANNKCLNVSFGVAPNPLISYDCGNFGNEVFTTVGVEWRAMGNMCVQAVGTGLQLQTCNGMASQKWDFFHPVDRLRFDQIRQNGTNTCVSSTTNNGALGELLKLATCSTTDTKQRFVTPGNGVLALSNNLGFCANVSGGYPTPNSPIILWNGCFSDGSAPFNSKFLLSGKIQALNNCMNIRNAANPFDPIAADACDAANTTTQVWEHYF